MSSPTSSAAVGSTSDAVNRIDQILNASNSPSPAPAVRRQVSDSGGGKKKNGFYCFLPNSYQQA